MAPAHFIPALLWRRCRPSHVPIRHPIATCGGARRAQWRRLPIWRLGGRPPRSAVRRSGRLCCFKAVTKRKIGGIRAFRTGEQRKRALFVGRRACTEVARRGRRRWELFVRRRTM